MVLEPSLPLGGQECPVSERGGETAYGGGNSLGSNAALMKEQRSGSQCEHRGQSLSQDSPALSSLGAEPPGSLGIHC